MKKELDVLIFRCLFFSIVLNIILCLIDNYFKISENINLYFSYSIFKVLLNLFIGFAIAYTNRKIIIEKNILNRYFYSIIVIFSILLLLLFCTDILIVPINYLREIIYNFLKINTLDYFDFISTFISVTILTLGLKIFNKINTR